MATYNVYSDTERAAVLAALKVNNGNYEQTSQATGVPWETIRSWANGDVLLTQTAEMAKLRSDKEEELHVMLERVARQSIEHTLNADADKQMNKAGYVGTMTTAAIAIDKMRLLRSEPTEITESRTKNVRATLQQIADEATEELVG